VDYQILPMGEVWSEGMFSVPTVIASKYIRLASAYQLKALLVILSDGGRSNSRDISKAIGVPESEVCDLLSFWVEEGVLLENGTAPAAQKTEVKAAAPVIKAESEKPKKQVEAMPVPTLSPADIVAALRDSTELSALMQEAESDVFGRTLSHVERQLIVNMVNYYGLPSGVVLTILQYYKTEKEKGRAIGHAYVAAMAKNWSEEGITTLAAADEKLREIEASDRMWSEIVSLSGIRHRRPTANQREMIKNWTADFSMEMIALACDTMRENAERPTLKYVDSVLKNWKKKGIKTPDDVAKDAEKHLAEKNGKDSKRHEIASTYDLDKITKDTMFNDDYDI